MSANLLFLIQQKSQIATQDINYSLGLVIVCLLILILLWLPDLINSQKK